MSQMEGARNFTPFTNSIKGPNRSTNNNIWTFRHVSLLEGLNQTEKKKFGQEVDNFILWGKHPLQCCATPYVHRSCESNFWISNLLQTLVKSWIVHKFVKVIQGGFVQTCNQEDAEFDSQIWSNHLLWWLGQRCTMSIVEHNVCLSKVECKYS
jgi:hypothetical protein